MKLIYLIIFCLFYSFKSYALEFSCIDKKYGRLSKIFMEDQLLKYKDEKGNPAVYEVLINSEKILMATSKGDDIKDPIVISLVIIRNKSLSFNTILRTIKESYNEIYTKDLVMNCIANN